MSAQEVIRTSHRRIWLRGYGGIHDPHNLEVIALHSIEESCWIHDDCTDIAHEVVLAAAHQRGVLQVRHCGFYFSQMAIGDGVLPSARWSGGLFGFGGPDI